MKLTIAYHYGDEDAAFVYSIKVHMFMKAAIDEFILKSCGLDKGHKDVGIWVTVTTKKDQENLEVELEELDPRLKGLFSQKVLNSGIKYDLRLPFKKISESDDPLKNYFHYIIEGLRIILKDYDVYEPQYDYVKEVCVKEISGNPEYELSSEETKGDMF